MLPINRHPSARELRSFARLWFPLFVALVGGVLWWRFDLRVAATVAWGIGAATALVVLASPPAARVVFVALLTVTYPIGLVVSTLALAVLFYGVFTPIGWAMRLAGRDVLTLRRRPPVTMWQPTVVDDTPARAFRQF